MLGLHHGQQHKCNTEDTHGNTDDVQTSRVGGRPRLGQHAVTEDHDDDTDGDVRPEDAAPTEEFDQQCTRGRPDSTAEPRDGGPDADGHGAPLDGELRKNERQRRREDRRSPGRLHDPEGDERARTGGKTAQQRPEGEDRHRDEEHPLPPELVGSSPGQQQQRGNCHVVDRQDPREDRVGGVEIGADGREGHIHDGGVDHHQEDADAHHPQHNPRPPRHVRHAGGASPIGDGITTPALSGSGSAAARRRELTTPWPSHDYLLRAR